MSDTIIYTGADGRSLEFSAEDMFESIDSIVLSDIAEIEGPFRFPEGDYVWEVTKSENVIAGQEGDKKAACRMVVTCAHVVDIVDKTIDASTLIGKEHGHMFWFGNTEEKIRDGMGRMRYTLRIAGLESTQVYKELRELNNGKQFKASIVHTKNQKDPKKPYINLEGFETVGGV